MKFSKATSILFVCASAASALRLPVIHRSVDVFQDEAIAKRSAAESDIYHLDRWEPLVGPDEFPEAYEFEQLDRRNSINDAEKEIIKYLRNINTQNIGGPHSWPTSKWEDLHGDNKSSFDGKYVCQVKKSGKNYEARVVAHKNIGKTIKQGYAFKTVTVPACKDKHGKELTPNYGRAVHFLRKAFGGDKPPKC